MKSAPLPFNEEERLESLRSYEILDTLGEEAFDQLTALAAYICGTPISLVSLVDEKRQWFKSKHGLSAPETPREVAFCAHAILQNDVFVVPDSLKDERFKDNPLATGAPHVRFYAGVPLLMPDNHSLGTLCVIDHKPRDLTSEQKEALRVLGRQVCAQLQLRRSLLELNQNMRKLSAANGELDRFSYFTAHELKAPLRAIGSLADMAKEAVGEGNIKEVTGLMEKLIARCSSSSAMVDGLLEYSRTGRVKAEMESFELSGFLSDLVNEISPTSGMKVHFSGVKASMRTDRTQLRQVLGNLIGNAIKYHDKPEGNITVEWEFKGNNCEFLVKDDGPGIDPLYHDKIFDLFNTGSRARSTSSTGLGLSIVRRLIEANGGEIRVESAVGGGAAFRFSWRINLP